MAQKREKAALKLFERHKKSLHKFVANYTKELTKVQKALTKMIAKNVVDTGKLRGRPKDQDGLKQVIQMLDPLAHGGRVCTIRQTGRNPPSPFLAPSSVRRA